MSTQTPVPFVGLSVQAVASVTGLCRATIYQAAAVIQLGAPAHFEYRGSALFYKPAGLCQLVEGLDRLGYTLAEAIRQRRQAAATEAGVTSPDSVRALARRWDVQAEARLEAAQEGAAV